MEILKVGSRNYTQVNVIDQPNRKCGNACHDYEICAVPGSNNEFEPIEIYFQTGPIKECGVNGCQNEDLIAIVIHRLQGFQSGEYACRENALALTKLEECLHWLQSRTQKYIDEGIEGASQKG